MAKRRNFTDQFKAKVALEALRGDKTVQEIAAKQLAVREDIGIHAHSITISGLHRDRPAYLARP